MEWKSINWKELGLKALFAGVYGALAELGATRSLDKETLYVAVAVAVLRGLFASAVVFENAIFPSTKAKGSSWKNCL